MNLNSSTSRLSRTSFVTIPLSDNEQEGRLSSSKSGQIGERDVQANFETKTPSFLSRSGIYLYGLCKLTGMIAAHFSQKAAALTSSGMKVLKATFSFGKTASQKGEVEMTDYPKRRGSLGFTLPEFYQEIAKRNAKEIAARQELENNLFLDEEKYGKTGYGYTGLAVTKEKEE